MDFGDEVTDSGCEIYLAASVDRVQGVWITPACLAFLELASLPDLVGLLDGSRLNDQQQMSLVERMRERMRSDDGLAAVVTGYRPVEAIKRVEGDWLGDDIPEAVAVGFPVLLRGAVLAEVLSEVPGSESVELVRELLEEGKPVCVVGEKDDPKSSRTSISRSLPFACFG